MTILLSLLFISMFVYVNTLYYSMVLLAIVLSLLYILVSNLMLHTLTMIMVAIVYIGAMMILIGYTCAICPNLILTPSHLSSVLYMFLILAPFFIFPTNFSPVFNSSFVPMTTYFYSYSGVLVFLSLIFMLFVTLLMVTSQYMTPKGPFRSVSI
uniref:NADH dehydrogenase subunit 6 n=1 Tax=Brachionus calyciflorus TaxID=104777 RepID=A0A6B9VJG2_9BILA|nr:NADH dehydrogenase subunit 6 [Brachionus calyciflorus]